MFEVAINTIFSGVFYPLSLGMWVISTRLVEMLIKHTFVE